jgi:hypothetical protein
MTFDLDTNRRRLMLLSLVTAGLGLLSLKAAQAATPETSMTSNPAHDFDLFFGSWHVKHRRIKERLKGSTEWIDFDGTCEMQPFLGGLANMDDNTFNFPPGPFRGVSLRAFDPATKNWAIWWLDSRFPTTVGVPVVGCFKDGVGTFLADDMWEGKPVKVRFIWSRITRDSREWEQAFSPDGGRTWETNWTSSFRRVK